MVTDSCICLRLHPDMTVAAIFRVPLQMVRVHAGRNSSAAALPQRFYPGPSGCQGSCFFQSPCLFSNINVPVCSGWSMSFKQMLHKLCNTGTFLDHSLCVSISPACLLFPSRLRFRTPGTVSKNAGRKGTRLQCYRFHTLTFLLLLVQASMLSTVSLLAADPGPITKSASAPLRLHRSDRFIEALRSQCALCLGADRQHSTPLITPSRFFFKQP